MIRVVRRLGVRTSKGTASRRTSCGTGDRNPCSHLHSLLVFSILALIRFAVSMIYTAWTDEDWTYGCIRGVGTVSTRIGCESTECWRYPNSL